MECKICNKGLEEVELFEGIFEEKIETVCRNCARRENIPLIKKPIFEEEKIEYLSVRERMEKLSNHKKPIPREQFIAHKNLAKLKFPLKREDHPDLIENYDWILKTARRRKKLSQTQLAEELIIPLQVIIDLESGKIAKDFTNYLEKLESFLEIEIRKRRFTNSISERKPINPEEEIEILERTKEKIKKEEEYFGSEDEINFKDKEALKKWTLKDLVRLKRKKDQDEFQKVETSEIVGDDLEIEE